MAEPCQVLVCTNLDCKERGAEALLEKLQQRMAASGVSDVAVKPYLCFGGCQQGPNIVVYPQRVWYAGVKESDLDDIVGHLKGGPIVSRLTDKVDETTQLLIFQLLDAGLY